MFQNVLQDAARLRQIKTKGAPWYVLESLLFENGYQAVVLYRIGNWFKCRRIPIFGPLVARISLWLTGVDISPSASIGPGLLIGHGVGLVIGGRVRIGARALLLHGVTIGAPGIDRREEMPQIGDDVFVGAGACLLGGIRVGNNVFVGANAVVTRDIEDDCRVLPDMPLKISSRSEAPAAGRP